MVSSQTNCTRISQRELKLIKVYVDLYSTTKRKYISCEALPFKVNMYIYIALE